MLKLITLLFTITLQLILFQGCAGYRYQEKSNPFAQYGIKSIHIPLFYNHSNLANTSAIFTREIYGLMSEFKGLQIQGSKAGADATLIGIIESADRLNETIVNRGLRVAKSVASESIGSKRGDFYVPSSSNVQLALRIVVIKNPTENEIKLLRSEFGKNVPVSSKVIFNEQIRVNTSYNREYFDGDGGNVHATLNRGAINNSLDLMAKNAASSFRDMILYAF